MTTILLQGLGLLWLVSEIVLNRASRARGTEAEKRDRSSITILCVTFALAFAGAALSQNLDFARIQLSRSWVHGVGLALLAAGMSIRASAIMTLGRFFNAEVTIHRDHHLIRAGMFRHVRHPSYSGLLLSFAGVSLMFENWISVAALLLLPLGAVFYRIRVEEAALVTALGEEYRQYQHSTKRLIPGIL